VDDDDACMLRQQRLLVPMALELTPEEVELVQEHEWVFQKNGFELEFSSSSSPLDTTVAKLVVTPYRFVVLFCSFGSLCEF
jgi:DNA mismatch repair ATPase MutL